MSKFCKYCGKELQEGEVCNCKGSVEKNTEQYEQASGVYENDHEQQQYEYTMVKKPFLPSYDVNVFAMLSLIMGISSLCTMGGIILGVLAIIFSVMAKKRVRKNDFLGQKFTKLGLIFGIISCVMWGLYILFWVMGIISAAMMW